MEQNGVVLFYEVLVENPDPDRAKRQSPPNSIEACFAAAGALRMFSVSVEGDQTSLTLDSLSKRLGVCEQEKLVHINEWMLFP